MTTVEVVAVAVPLAIVFFTWLMTAAVDVHRCGPSTGRQPQWVRCNRIGGLWRQRHRR